MYIISIENVYNIYRKCPPVAGSGPTGGQGRTG